MGTSSVPLRVALIGTGPYSVLGGYFGWYYLRFLNKNLDQTVGDVSDDFAFVVLLPDFCRYVVQTRMQHSMVNIGAEPMLMVLLSSYM
jgi:hypothetical protein